MITKLIENELYVADKITLTPEERLTLDLFLTFEKIDIEILQQDILGTDQKTMEKIIKSLNKKVGFYYKINKFKKGTFYNYYKIKPRRN